MAEIATQEWFKSLLAKAKAAGLIGGGFSVVTWLETAGISAVGYDTLKDVLADESVLEELMNDEDAVDYLVNEFNLVKDQITTNENAMKYIGLSDYATDMLMVLFSSDLLGSKYWEYILKDKVPVMTSNTTPSGEVFANGFVVNYEPWKAFNGQISAADRWNSARDFTLGEEWIGYKFDRPTKVNMLGIILFNNQWVFDEGKFTLQGSFDGLNYYNLETIYWKKTAEEDLYPITNDNYYTYYRLVMDQYAYFNEENNTYGVSLSLMQLYGRSLNGLVPLMTSNTAPRGEVIFSSEYDATHLAYRAFTQKDESPYWIANTPTDAYIGYKFENPERVKAIGVRPYFNNHLRVKNFILQASNNGTDWTDVYTGLFEKDEVQSIRIMTIDNNEYFKYYRLFVVDNFAGSGLISVERLQFYGSK